MSASPKINIYNFFHVPLVKFGVHVFLIIAFWLNIYHFYNLWRVEEGITQKDDEIQRVKEFTSQTGYFESDLFREKYIKERNFKKKGEIVLDTSQIDGTDTRPNPNYIPAPEVVQESNLDKWVDCFLSTEKECLEDTSD
jgi:phosphotransferase system  glucose/maltose/N-acetylglucosamine-specific IIC component